MGAGNMEAVYFGCGDVAPASNGSLPPCISRNAKGQPYVYADLERMHTMMEELPPTYIEPVDFVAAIVKGRPGEMAIKVGDAQKHDSLQTVYAGPRPSGYRKMAKQGAIVLGVGGDNSPWGAGTFFEGVMTRGFSSDATDAAVLQNIVAAKFHRTND